VSIALLGATGFVGSALLNEALNRGHTITAIVRHPEKLEPRDRLVVKEGDVYDSALLANLIQGQDAVISAFNPGWKDPNLYDDQVRGTASIVAAIKKAGIKRVLWVGGAGGLEVKSGVRVIDSPDLPDWVRIPALWPPWRLWKDYEKNRNSSGRFWRLRRSCSRGYGLGNSALELTSSWSIQTVRAGFQFRTMPSP
jgi:hypothetical protein